MSNSDEELLTEMLKDEEQLLYPSSSRPVSLLLQTTAENDATLPPADALRVLRKFFGHHTFRPLQWTIIKNALDGKDQIIVLSTGYGKSVCYQFPSLYTEKLTVVISPLVSLMNDQVNNIRSNGVEAACISGETNLVERQSFLNSTNLRLLYVTPEFALSNLSLISSLRKNITLLAIDEAHCVSHWGHEFRPRYRQLAKVRHILGPDIPLMAITATATEKVRSDIASSLELQEPIFMCGPLDRPNLHLSVRTPRNLEVLLSLVTEEDDRNGKHFGGPTIIYCSTRAVVNEVRDFLSKKGVKCRGYHAGMSVFARRKAHENFVKDRITTIIATVAFGMGIDKPDVRNVIHYGAPRNIESYYQEIGRAGRDGHPSRCITFYNDQDVTKLRHHIFGEHGLKEEYKKHLVDMLLKMEHYLHSTSCRRFFLLSHFDDHVKKESPHAGCCDVCDQLIEFGNSNEGISLNRTRNYGDEALILIQAIAMFHGYTGLGKVIDFVKGKANVDEAKQKNELYGSGKHKSEAFWKEMGRILRMNGFITERRSPYNNFVHFISLSDKGEAWLQNSERELYVEPTLPLIGRNRVSDRQNTSCYTPLFHNIEPLQFKLLNRTKQRIWKDCSCYEELATDPELSNEVGSKMSTMSETHVGVYRNHIKGKLSLSEIAEQCAVSESTITSYFVNFVKNGLPIHLDAVGINKEHISVVYNTIRKHGSDILRLKFIMDKLPEGLIDYNRMKIIVAIMEYEYGIEKSLERTSPIAKAAVAATVEGTKKRSIPEWMKKPGPLYVQNKKNKKSNLFK